MIPWILDEMHAGHFDPTSKILLQGSGDMVHRALVRYSNLK